MGSTPRAERRAEAIGRLTVAVFGAGAVGSYYGKRLAGGEAAVFFISRGHTVIAFWRVEPERKG